MQYEKNPFYTLPVLLQLPRRCESGVKVSLCFCRGVVLFIIRREGALVRMSVVSFVCCVR